MADNPRDPKDDGKVGMPNIGPGMNKRRPAAANDYDDPKRLGANDTEKDAQEDAKILERLRKRFERCIAYYADDRKRQMAALEFKAGKQWSDADATQRNIDQRPCLTINRLPVFIRQVTNDQRMNRPAIAISPVGAKGDAEAAKTYAGMIRALERKCSADIAYDTAFESAVTIGVGFWRILIEWEGDDTFDQTIVVKRVRNPFSIYGDPDGQEPDGADWRFAFATEMIPTDEFKDKYPKADVINFDMAGQGERFKEWLTKDTVRVAEYFEVTKEKTKLVKLDNGFEGFEDQLHDDVKAAIKSGKIQVLDERDAWERKVMWYKVTATQILEREEWPGKWIPIVPVLGNETDIAGKVQLSGLIEPAMDPQRMYNYYRTKEAEAVALAPMAPFVMEEGQAEGHEDEWRNANRTANAVLFYKGTSIGGRQTPPPQRQSPPGIPEGFVHGAEGAANDIMATTGIRFDVQADHRNVDDRSGKAIREFNRPQDLGASHYLDNFKRAKLHTGNIFVDLISKVYVEKQVVDILREDDTEGKVTLDPHAPKAQDDKQVGGKNMTIFNPNIGKYGVTVTIGPSYATRRIEAADSMLEFAKTMPQTAHLIADLIAKNMDWEGHEEMADRLAKALPPGLLTPDMKDVPPQVQALIQSLQNQLKQAGEQMKAMQAELNDKGADRAIAQDKIDRDYEAKILGIFEKAEANHAKILAEQARTFMDAVKSDGARSDAKEQAELAAKQPKEKTDA